MANAIKYALDKLEAKIGTGGTADHSVLENRDRPDQHPIGAISGLQGSLDGKINTEDLKAITTEELLAILK